MLEQHLAPAATWPQPRTYVARADNAKCPRISDEGVMRFGGTSPLRPGGSVPVRVREAMPVTLGAPLLTFRQPRRNPHCNRIGSHRLLDALLVPKALPITLHQLL